MSGTVRVFKNIVALLSERVVVPLANLVIVILIARWQGSEGLGRFSAVIGFVSAFDILLDLGVNTLMVREVSRDRLASGRLASRATTLKLAVFPFILLAVTVFLRFVHYPQETVLAFYLFSAAFMTSALAETFSALYKAWERMELLALVVLVRQLGVLVSVVVVLIGGAGLYAIAMCYLVVGVFCLVLTYALYSMKVERIRLRFDTGFYDRLFENSLPFITLGFFFLMFYRVGVVIVSTVAGDAQAGYFSAASKVVASLLLLSTPFMDAVFPIISRFEPGSDHKIRPAVKDAFHLLSVISFPMAAGLAMTGADFIRLMYGRGFDGAVPVMTVLSMTLPLAYLASALHYVAMARDMQKKSFWGILAVTSACGALCYGLVSRFGGLGAAYATLLYSVLVLVFLAFLVFRDIGDSSSPAEVIRPLAASVAMAAALYFMSDVWVFARAGAGAGVYAAVLWAVGGISDSDVTRFREITRHFSPAKPGKSGSDR